MGCDLGWSIELNTKKKNTMKFVAVTFQNILKTFVGSVPKLPICIFSAVNTFSGMMGFIWELEAQCQGWFHEDSTKRDTMKHLYE